MSKFRKGINAGMKRQNYGNERNMMLHSSNATEI
jgi:hypothetical protein